MAQLTNVQAACYLASAGWPASVIPTVVAIGHPESGLDTGAVNPNPVDGYKPTGWLQVVAYPDRTARWNLLDPLANAQAARSVYQSQGLGAWSTYTDGSYRSYLAQVERDLSGWTPAQCTGSGAAGSSSASPLGIASAAASFGGTIGGIGMVLLGVVILGVAALLVVSQTRAGAAVARGAWRTAKTAAMVVK